MKPGAYVTTIRSRAYPCSEMIQPQHTIADVSLIGLELKQNELVFVVSDVYYTWSRDNGWSALQDIEKELLQSLYVKVLYCDQLLFVVSRQLKSL